MDNQTRSLPAHPSTANRTSLAESLTAIRAHPPGSPREMNADVVRAKFTSTGSDLTANDMSLISEVQELGRTIAEANFGAVSPKFKVSLQANTTVTGPQLQVMGQSDIAKLLTSFE